NTGTVTYSDLGVIDTASPTYGDDFKVEFQNNAGTLEYRVINMTTGDQSAFKTYESGKPIQLDADGTDPSMRVTLTGTPDVNDSFIFAQGRSGNPQIQENNFLNTLHGIIQRLNTGKSSPQNEAAL